jgi:alanyl-tRNA synthetase
LSNLVGAVRVTMENVYPELTERFPKIMSTVANEELRFSRTLEEGVDRVGGVLDDIRARGERSISGEEVFRLYDTFGIPIDLTAEMAEEEGVTLDREGFETLMAGARAKAKASSKFYLADNEWFFQQALKGVGPTKFVGYDQYTKVPATVVAVLSKSGRSQVDKGEEAVVVL